MGEAIRGGILDAVLDAPAVIPLSGLPVPLAFAVLAWMVAGDRSPLDGLDTWGRNAEDWADDHRTF